MTESESTILGLIEEDKKRAKETAWGGSTLGDYVREIIADPAFDPYAGFTPFQMIHRAIIAAGTVIVDPRKEDPRLRRIHGDEPYTRYVLFSDFHGIDETLERIVNYYDAAARHAEESRQVLFLWGEAGTGKSAIAERIAEGLEQHIPRFFAVEGCPSHHSPLFLLPSHIRLALRKEHGIRIHGRPCSACRASLIADKENGYWDVPVGAFKFSPNGNLGYGALSLTGDQGRDYLSLFGEVNGGTKRSPGSLQHAGSGILEIIDLKENTVTSIVPVLTTATQEGYVIAPDGSRLWVSAAIIAHGNEPGYKALLDKPGMRRRIKDILVPYPLELNAEVRIYRQFFENSAFTTWLAPLVFEVLGTFAILTRLKKEEPCPDLLTRLRVYNGEVWLEKGVEKTFKNDRGDTVPIIAFELRFKTPSEGRGIGGLAPPLAIQILHDTIVRNPEQLFPFHLFEFMERIITSREPGVARNEWKERLEIARKWYHERLEEQLLRAMNPSYGADAEILFQQYLDNVGPYVMKQKIRVRKADGSTEEIDPDIPFLKSIEEQIAIIGPAAEQFRKDISSALMRAMRGGGDQRSNLEQAPQLERAIGLYLQNTVRDICRILAKTDPVDTEGRDKKAKWVGRIQELGYLDPDAVLTVLRYVSHNIWKD